MNLVPKIEAFRDVEHLKNILSRNNIGGFRPWRNDGYKWISFSDYYNFGNKSQHSGLQNNLAYYISSDIVEYAQEVKLILNINNIDSAKEAIDTFIRIALKTFTALNLYPPHNMLISIAKGITFTYQNDKYLSEFQILKTKITSCILVINTVI